MSKHKTSIIKTWQGGIRIQRYTPLEKWNKYSIEHRRFFCRNYEECGNLSQKPKRFYCSEECRNKILRKAYAQDYFRDDVLERDDYICQVCGSKKNIDAHHIIPVEFGGTYDIDNGIALCVDCHTKEHKVLNESSTYKEERKKKRIEFYIFENKIKTLDQFTEGVI